jgi:hypothetical protein
VPHVDPPPKGNARAGTHLAYSERHLAPRGDALLVELRQVVPDRREADEPMLRQLAMVLARIERVYEYLDEHGVFKAGTKGVPQPILTELARWENLALRLSNSFGMTPSSRVELRMAKPKTWWSPNVNADERLEGIAAELSPDQAAGLEVGHKLAERHLAELAAASKDGDA